MDWTKAKTILIVALILTNSVLLYVFVFQEDKNSEKEATALITYLENKGIFVDTEIPVKSSKMPVLDVEFDKGDEEIINEMLKKQLSLESENFTEESMKSSADKFLLDCEFMTENVVFDDIIIQDDKTTINYKNQVDAYNLEESYMRVIFKNGKIIEFERYWLNPLEFGYQKKAIISAEVGLVKFASNIKMEEGNEKTYHISDIEIVYWLDFESFKSESMVFDTAWPAWKITYNDGKIDYISAFE